MCQTSYDTENYQTAVKHLCNKPQQCVHLLLHKFACSLQQKVETVVSKLTSNTTDTFQLLRAGASSNQLCWPLHHRDTSGFTGKKLKSQEKRFLIELIIGIPKLGQGMCVSCSLSQERRKKSLSLLSEDEDDWHMEYYLPSHTSGAIERICILGAQEEKQRDRGKAESASSLQRAPTATALHCPALRTQPQPWPAAPHPANSPSAKGNPWQGSALVICWTKWALGGYMCHVEHWAFREQIRVLAHLL